MYENRMHRFQHFNLTTRNCIKLQTLPLTSSSLWRLVNQSLYISVWIQPIWISWNNETWGRVLFNLTFPFPEILIYTIRYFWKVLKIFLLTSNECLKKRCFYVQSKTLFSDHNWFSLLLGIWGDSADSWDTFRLLTRSLKLIKFPNMVIIRTLTRSLSENTKHVIIRSIKLIKLIRDSIVACVIMFFVDTYSRSCLKILRQFDQCI